MAKSITTFHDVWNNLNVIDKEIATAKDLSRTKAKIQVNRQRIDMIKVAVKVGLINNKFLALSSTK